MRFRNETVILAILIVLGTLAGLIGAKGRFSAEQHNKRTEIVVDYNDAMNLALGARQPLSTVLDDLHASGVTTLAVWENPIDDLRTSGAILVNAIDPSHTRLTFSPSFPGQEERVIAALRNKTSVPFHARHDVLIVDAPYSQISGLGIGLDPAQTASAVQHGFLISPRLYNYSGVTPQAISWMLSQAKRQCRGRANVVIFNGGDVLGNRGDIDATADALRANGLLYGSLELGKQIGDPDLSRLAPDITVRVHSIGGNEMPTMDEPTAVARFALAAREREIRSCYVRLFQNSLIHQPDVLAANISFIQDVVHALQDGGIRTGAAHPFTRDPRPMRVLLLLMGIATAAGLLMLARQFLPLSGASFWICFIGTAIICGYLSTREPAMTGRLIVALLSAMVFPSLALILHQPSRNASATRNPLHALERGLRSYELMTLTTACGIVLIVGLLADRLMLVKVFEFIGIRLAIITPLILYVVHQSLGLNELAPNASWEQRKARMRAKAQRIAASPLLLGQVLFGIVVLAIVGVIVLRSGNDPGVGVSSSELSFRALLNRILYVRPRTKEILFGFPLLVAGLALYYSGRKRWYPLFACAGAIGMADLLNTFCHIHTPLLISTIRALLGWTIGLVVGIALYYVLHRTLPADDLRGKDENLSAPGHNGDSGGDYDPLNSFAYSQPDYSVGGQPAPESQEAPSVRGVSLSR